MTRLSDRPGWISRRITGHRHNIPTYAVEPEDRHWQVLRGNEVIGEHATKRTAIAEADASARRDTPSHLYVYRNDGVLEDAREYGKAKRSQGH